MDKILTFTATPAPINVRPMTPFEQLISANKTVAIGMVHLAPLFENGQTWPLSRVEARAVEDALSLTEAGFDALLIENYGDVPFYPHTVPPHTVSAMTRIALAVQNGVANQRRDPPLLGINVLRNDAISALAIASAVGAHFVRINVHAGAMVTDQGIIEGKAHQTSRYRDRIAPDCDILADVHVKHAAPLVNRPIEDEAYDLWHRGRVAGIVVSGSRTNAACDVNELRRIRETVPECRLVVGSGVCPDQFNQLAPLVDAVIVGSWIKEDGKTDNRVDRDRAHQLMESIATHRRETD